MPSLRETVARLAAGSNGRTEADIQADVRGFLLQAPFELANDQVVDVSLEAQAGHGQRIDVEAGRAVIEVKKNLTSKSVRAAAIDQLNGYVIQRTEMLGQRYVGVLTDGQTWLLFHLQPDQTLAEVSNFTLRVGEGARLAAWLEPVLATQDGVKPTPGEILRRLGASSPAAQLDLADLRALYDASRTDPEVQLKRQLWARLLLSALGTNFEDSDELFVTHTYLVLVAELLAHQVMGFPVDVGEHGFREVLAGQRFAMHGVHGVVEADFFDWPATMEQGDRIVGAIARRLASFDWSEVDRDVLKALYQSIIDKATRRKLGEYYTPDWLAQKMVNEHFADPLSERLLDPACGSGTFLFWSVRRALKSYEAAGIPMADALVRVVDHVQGMDLHPVAVTLARVTYLLALTPARIAQRADDLTVPVFLGDSVRWRHDDVRLSDSGMTVQTAEELELLEDELHFPESVLEEPARFDRLVSELAAKATKRRRNSQPPSIEGLLNHHNVVGEPDREAVKAAFRKLCRLHDVRRDHVWSYYIRNRARPLSFMRDGHRADVVAGNPPWLSYRSMPVRLQEDYRVLAEERGLWAGGKVATHQDLSDLFVVRSIEQYLKLGGRFAFVMPYAALSRRQFAGFRSGSWPGAETAAAFEAPEDFARVKPPLFPVPSCVVAGVKAVSPSALPAGTRSWTGRVPSEHLDWAAAAEHLSDHVDDIASALDVAESPYRARFAQGATFVPRVLVIVEERPSGPLGVAQGRVAIRSARSSNEKEPWKHQPSLEGVVEGGFLRPLHSGSTIVAFRARTPERAVVPWTGTTLLDGTCDELDEYPGLAEWWRQAEALWMAKRTKSSRLSLRQRVDFHGGLHKQFPISEHRVVYSASGQHLAACRLTDTEAVIEHKLYWATVASVSEGRYLCAVLNSQVLADVVVGLQSRGQHNPRDFDTHVFALPFRTFDAKQALHIRLAELAERAEDVANEVALDEQWQFQRARRAVREALREDGVAAAIDDAVNELAIGTVADAGTPDLTTAFAQALEGVRMRRKRDREVAATAGTPLRRAVRSPPA